MLTKFGQKNGRSIYITLQEVYVDGYTVVANHTSLLGIPLPCRQTSVLRPLMFPPPGMRFIQILARPTIFLLQAFVQNLHSPKGLTLTGDKDSVFSQT